MPKTKAKAEAKEAPTPAVEKQPETPEKAGGPRPAATIASSALPPPNGAPPAGRAADLMTAPEQGAGAAGRARMMREMQQSVGNARLSRLVGSPIQSKLTVGAPNDVYEQEADRVANRVMRMPEPRPAQANSMARQSEAAGRTGLCPECEKELQCRVDEERAASSGPASLQRAISKVQLCPDCARTLRRQLDEAQPETAADSAAGLMISPVSTEESVQRQPAEEEMEAMTEAEETGPVQSRADSAISRQPEAARAGSNGQTPEVDSDTESYLNTSSGGGQPLSESSRAFMEPRFGQDFSGVRVHTDSRAANAAKGLNAQAFTRGQDIYFGEGQYGPGSDDGKKLLAHELTHVEQQKKTETNPHAKMQISKIGGERVQGGFWGSVWGGIKSAGSAVGGAAKWAGGKVWSGAKWVGGQVANIGKNAWKCAKATGRSIANIVTLDVTSIYDLIGIRKPTEGDSSALETIMTVLQHPCLMMIPGYSQLIGVVKKLKGVGKFLSGAWRIIKNPGLVVDAIKESLGGFINKIPQKAHAITQKAITFSEPSQEHLKGIWRHLQPKLEYLTNNWWEVIKEAGKEMLYPWRYSGKDLSAIGDGIVSAADNIWHWTPKFSKALDDLLKVWRAVNSLVGRWYGWIFIASVLIGAIIGSIFGGGVGAIPGAVAGAKFALAVGKVLVASTIAAETASILKAGYDLVQSNKQSDEQDEEDYEQIANSGLSLAIIGIMAALGALAVRFARGLIARVRGLFKKKPRTKGQKLEALKAERAEKARIKEIEEGIKQLDDDITKGRKSLPKDQLDWLKADSTGRRKELAFDKDIGNYRVNEAKAALRAERQGSLPRPVRRATSPGDDFIDGAGKVWDHKAIDPSLSVKEAVREIVRRASGGENILADLSSMTSSKATAVRVSAMTALVRSTGAGKVAFVPAGPSAPGVVGGVAGERVAEGAEENMEKER